MIQKNLWHDCSIPLLLGINLLLGKFERHLFAVKKLNQGQKFKICLKTSNAIAGVWNCSSASKNKHLAVQRKKCIKAFFSRKVLSQKNLVGGGDDHFEMSFGFDFPAKRRTSGFSKTVRKQTRWGQREPREQPSQLKQTDRLWTTKWAASLLLTNYFICVLGPCWSLVVVLFAIILFK